MDMEVTAWMSLYNAMHAQEDRRPFSKATLRRIVGFALPHRRKLALFLVLSVMTAAGVYALIQAATGGGRVCDYSAGGPGDNCVGEGYDGPGPE